MELETIQFIGGALLLLFSSAVSLLILDIDPSDAAAKGG